MVNVDNSIPPDFARWVELNDRKAKEFKVLARIFERMDGGTETE
jgi:hypothetical protein